MIYQTVVLILCHLFITKVSFMFVDSEVGRLANPSLFDVLEEKVIIFDEESNEILYQNGATV